MAVAGSHGFSGVGPFEWMRQSSVEVREECEQFILKVGHGDEVPASHDLSHHNSEDHLDLVQPRTVLGKVYEPNAMAGIGQELATSGLGLEHSVATFFFPTADSAHTVPPPIRPGRPTNAH